MQFSLQPSSFRHDINGLRAWAVASVVLFHYLVPGFAGGFVGVDIFFVISGYLMTGIVVQGLAKGQLHVGRFYVARAVRIIPALVVLVAVLLAWAWFYLPTPGYQELAGHARYALVFWSNVDFAGADSYFAASSHENWLLHTWSLSAEWQFYLLFPLYLLLVSKLSVSKPIKARLTALFAALVVLILASLGYSVWLSPREPTAAFYLLHTRAWEMAAGGLAYFLSISNWRFAFHRYWVAACGWLLLISSFLWLHSDLPWPGAWALWPVVGTVLILLSDQQHDPLTRSKMAQWLGDRSYSIYLWHWPFAVWLYFTGALANPLAVVLAIGLSLIAGHLSFRWVEQPVRLGLKTAPLRRKLAIVLLPLVVVLAASLVIRNVAFEGRLDPQIERIAAEAENKNPLGDQCRQSRSRLREPCVYGGEKLGAIVLGDSHAAAIIRSVEAAMDDPQKHVLDWTMSACPTIEGVKNSGRHEDRFLCPNFIDYALEQSAALPSDVPLLIVNRISSYLHGSSDAPDPEIYLREPYTAFSDARVNELLAGFEATVCKFSQQRPVFVLKPVPEMPTDVPKFMSREARFHGRFERVAITRDAYQARHQAALEALEGLAQRCEVTLLDPVPALCDDEHCYGDLDGLPVYFDDDHLNERGGRLLVPEFERLFSDRLE